jgi:nitrite reductase/ring-hydroxylating ferredoxin subunit
MAVLRAKLVLSKEGKQMLKRRTANSMPSIGKVGKVALCLLLVALTLTLAACSGSTSTPLPTIKLAPAKTVAPAQTTAPITNGLKPSGPVDAKWIEPQVNGNTVSVPLSEIENSWNTRFKLQTASGPISAMAYMSDGVIYVRANLCTPCRSQGFTLSGNTLICDICGTRFAAGTGLGVSGSCVNYPIASAAYKINGGYVVMNEADLVAAYQKTLKG